MWLKSLLRRRLSQAVAVADVRVARVDIADGASFRLAGLWLDDAEFAALMRDLVLVLQPAAANPPRPGRKRRILATVLLPGEEAGAIPNGETS
jgi:hypothetical protein